MNIKKIVLFLFLFSFVIGASSYTAPKVEAAVSFPAGCSSAIGYSIVNGDPCNGTSSATLPILGCSSVLGYSISNGVPCSGTTEAISFLGGCSSVYAYSTATGAACNGTAFATLYSDQYVAPGLPTTGVAGLTTFSVVMLGLFVILSVGFVMYSARPSKKIA